MKKHFEPFWWSLFGAGGAVSALVLPALLLIIGIAIPLGLVNAPTWEKLQALTQPVISRLIIFAMVSLSFFHWAHRFRFTLYDGLQLKRWDKIISVFCYGGAIAVTLYSGYLLFIK